MLPSGCRELGGLRRGAWGQFGPGKTEEPSPAVLPLCCPALRCHRALKRLCGEPRACPVPKRRVLSTEVLRGRVPRSASPAGPRRAVHEGHRSPLPSRTGCEVQTRIPGALRGTALPSLPSLRGRGRTTHPCPFCGRGCREGVCAAGFFHPCVPLSHFLPERVRSCSPAAAGGQMQHGSTGPRGVPMAPRASPGATSPDLGVRAELHLWRRHVLWKCFSRAGQRWSTLISGSPASGRTQRGRLVPFQRGDAGSPEVGRCERSSGFHSLVLAGM